MSGAIKFYKDLTMISEVSAFQKNASLTSDIISRVEQYVSNHIDPNDRFGSLVNILGPGAIALTFKAMGMGWIGSLIAFAMQAFHINIGGIVESIWDALKSELSAGRNVSSAQVDSAVQNAVQQHAGTDKTSSNIEIRMLKLALVEYDHNLFALNKEPSFKISRAAPTKAATTSFLGSLLSVVFKIALASAGFMVAGDVVNKFLHRPNALDNTLQQGHPVAQAPTSRSKQKIFPINPSYQEAPHSGTWAVPIVNEPSNIENMLVQFAKDVYSGLDGHESAITSSPTFQKIKSDIAWYNHASAGDKVVIIPNKFSSKKDLVDYFIDEVAQNAK